MKAVQLLILLFCTLIRSVFSHFRMVLQFSFKLRTSVILKEDGGEPNYDMLIYGEALC